MIGRHLIEQFRIDELQPGFEQFGSNDHGHCAADEKHDQAEHQVHGADVFVVGGEQPALDPGGRPIVVLVVLLEVGGAACFKHCHGRSLFNKWVRRI